MNTWKNRLSGNKGAALMQAEAAKTPRPAEELKALYTQACQRAGDLQYRIKCLSGELEATNQELWKINQEHVARFQLDKAAEAKAAAPEAAPAVAEVSNG